jgi:hypothetical protein
MGFGPIVSEELEEPEEAGGTFILQVAEEQEERVAL